MTYIVTAPYVTMRVRDEVTGSWVLIGYYKGAPVPESVNEEDLERHLRKGMVEKAAGAEAKAIEKSQAEAKKAEEEAAAEQAAADKKAEADRLAADKAAAKQAPAKK